jgi:hypothetical protein
VRRYGWNSGNTVWRIADPRGFELEISSANFARIVDCTTLDKGAIAARCVWGRCGSENILLPESSDVFIEAQKETVRRSTTVKVGELAPGDVVDLLGGYYWEGGPATYLGKHWILGVAHTTEEIAATGTLSNSSSWLHRNTRTETTGWRYETKPVARYIFELTDGKFVCGTTPKISSIVEKARAPLDKVVTAQRLCGATIAGAGYGAQWFVWPDKIDHKKISLSFKPAANKLDRIKELKAQSLENRIGVVRVASKFYSFGRLYSGAAHPNKSRYQQALVALEPLDPKAGYIKYEQNGQAVNQLFGGKTTFLRMSEYEEEELDGMEPFDLWLEYDGKYELKVPMVTPYSFSALS